MTTMTCPPAEQLKAFYLGQLPDDRSDELVAHVGVCSACQAELETVVDAEDSLIANLREPDDGSNLDREPACEMGMLRALGALATVYEPTTDENSGNNVDATLPKTIGEYEIVRALGQGGMGHVYLARHSKLGRLVALKILAGHRLGDRRASQRFEAEMRAIGRLSHPNIVTAHDAREIDGTAVLVTEFIDGFDLGQLLQRTGPLSVADACEIIRQVALALQYTSDQGFVHRDVKPSNIMLSASGEVKLLDLGLARLQFGDVESADVTGTGQTMGTADYISPEQVTDSRKVDVRSDIYSLGVTLFKLLVGRAPFADAQYSTAFAKMTAHVSTTPATVRSLRNDVPEELSRLVASMLAKRPEDRPQKPDLIAAKLSAFMDGSNLELLARTAALVDVTQAATNSVTTSVEPKTLTQSFWHRPVKLYLAIASGLVGILLGFCFGIIITITNPDGSKTVMELPRGSKVEVSEGGNNTNNALKTNADATPVSLISFLEFGAVIPKGSENVKFFRMVPVADNVEISNPVLSKTDPQATQISVSVDANNLVSADMIWGHLLEAKLVKKGDSSALEMTFDESLSRRMQALSSAHIGHQLAIIVEGRIVAAPRINSPIGSKAVLEGTFTTEQLERLEKWLRAALTAAPHPAATNDLGVTLKTPAPTFNGHTLDEWLSLLQTEQSAGGHQAAIAGLEGLLTKQNTDQILKAVSAAIETRKSATAEELDLLRLAAGPDAYAEWIFQQLDKNEIALTKSILCIHSNYTGQQITLSPVLMPIAEWLAEPMHQLRNTTDGGDVTLQTAVQDFLVNLFYSPEVKGEALEVCLRAARNQPIIGDAETFLLGVPSARGAASARNPSLALRFPEDERLQVFAELAIKRLLAETDDVLQATRAMAVLIAYPQWIPNEKIPPLIEVTKKRFAKLLPDRNRFGAIVDAPVTDFKFVPDHTQKNLLVWNPKASRCSETLSLLYFAHFLGSPPELKEEVVKLKAITQPAFEQASLNWQEYKKQNRNSFDDFLIWPFDKATVEQHAVISKLGPDVWRAAYFDQITDHVLQTFSCRSNAASELAGSDALAFLGQAMRDFARIDKHGIRWELRMQDLNVSKWGNEARDILLKSIVSNFKTIEADGDNMLSVTEYARYLADKAKQSVSSVATPSQPLVPSKSPEEELAPSDFGGKPSVPPKAKEHNRLFSEALYAFALSLTEDRKAPITEQNLDRLAAKLVPSADTEKVKKAKDTLRKLWPFKGVTGILPGVPKEADWLLAGQETGYTMLIDPPVMLKGIRTLVDDVIADQPGVFDDIWSALKDDPQGPQIDGAELIKHLGNQLIFCTGTGPHPYSLLAFSITNPEAVQSALRNFNDSHEDIRILKNYLVLGTKEHVEGLIARVAESPELQASNNLKQIGIAFANFESSYRQLPASRNYREGGIGFNGPRAKHPFSWRVAILPFIEHNELFQQYDFNEPWDSPKNLKLLEKMPAVYRSPYAPSDQKAGLTNYLGLAGIICAMGDDVGVPLTQIKDGTSSTVLLVETKQTVTWTKPEDLPFNDYADAKLARPFNGLDLNCLMVDGTVLSLKQPIDWERLGTMVTKDRGEER